MNRDNEKAIGLVAHALSSLADDMREFVKPVSYNGDIVAKNFPVPANVILWADAISGAAKKLVELIGHEEIRQ